MTKNTVLKILGGIIVVAVVLFIAIQFVPVERTNPPVVSEPDWDSPETKALMQRACFDCHSNETKWPAYAYIAPISWLVAHDVDEGRAEFNLSDWANHPGEGDEMVDEVEEGGMPLPIYLSMHPEAVLTAAEKEQLITGIKATFGSEGGGEGNENGEGGESGEGGEAGESGEDAD